MGVYAQSIVSGAIISIFVVMLLSLPVLIHFYRKYDGVYLRNSVVVVSFIIYLCCAYALIIFPLPTIEESINLKTELYSFRPFRFIGTFLKESPFNAYDNSTWLVSLRHHSFLEPFFNFLLLMPLGVYITGFFSKKLRYAVLAGFCISLFFEITQLTGLYGIYPRPYRLFDVDDLITNTSGAFIGGCIGLLVHKLAPAFYLHEPVKTSHKPCSLLRRAIALFADSILFYIIWGIVFGVLYMLFPTVQLSTSDGYPYVAASLLQGAGFFLYCWLFSLILHGQTPGKKLLKVQVYSADLSKANAGQLAAHYGISTGVCALFFASFGLANLFSQDSIRYLITLLAVLALGGFLFLFTVFVRKDKRMWYERCAGTRCASTFIFDEKVLEVKGLEAADASAGK